MYMVLYTYIKKKGIGIIAPQPLTKQNIKILIKGKRQKGDKIEKGATDSFSKVAVPKKTYEGGRRENKGEGDEKV